MMQESPFTYIEHFSFEEHLRRERERKYLITHILRVLIGSIPSSDIQLVKQTLESIQDHDRLVDLFNKASNTTDVDALLQALYESEV